MPRGFWLLMAALVLIGLTAIFVVARFYGLR